MKGSHVHKAVAVFKVCVLEFVDLRVCMIFCISARYALHNCYKLLNKQPVLNTTSSVLNQKNKVPIYFASESRNHAVLPILGNNNRVK
jgi:hypothetical protein